MLRFGKKLLAIILSVLIAVSAFGMSFSVSALETPQLAASAGDGASVSTARISWRPLF